MTPRRTSAAQAYIEELLDAAPPLTQEQLDSLAALFASSSRAPGRLDSSAA